MKKLILTALFAAACGGSEPAPHRPRKAEEPKAAPAEAAPAAAPAEAAPEAAAPEAAAPAGASAAAIERGSANMPGAVVYNQYCVACHQADGTGMNGTLAGDYVNDKTRLAKSDEELIHNITAGVTGKIGAMPAWGGTLNEQQIKDVLAYVRATYGEKK